MKKIKEKKEVIGKIHPAKTLFLRVNVGTADSGKDIYEMTLGAGDSSPIVCHKGTGKYFTLSWSDIINLAIDAGINEK